MTISFWKAISSLSRKHNENLFIFNLYWFFWSVIVMIVLYLLARIIISVIHSYLFWFSMSFFYFTLFFNFIWERKIYAKKIFYMFAKISRSFLISLFILFCLFFLLLVFLFIKFLELRFLAFFSFFVNLFK